MIHLTENAAQHVASYIAGRGKGEGIRLGVKTSGCSGLAYVLEFVDETKMSISPIVDFFLRREPI